MYYSIVKDSNADLTVENWKLKRDAHNPNVTREVVSYENFVATIPVKIFTIKLRGLMFIGSFLVIWFISSGIQIL